MSILQLSLIALLLLSSIPSRAEESTAREARLLFAVVFKDLETLGWSEAFNACELPSTWTAFEKETRQWVRDALNSEASVELSAPYRNAEFQKLFDPTGEHATAFCVPEMAKKNEEDKYIYFQSSSDSYVHIRYFIVTPPIFDKIFRRAAFVVSHTLFAFQKTTSGIKKLPPIIVVFVAIYEKGPGGWRFKEIKEMGIS
jgi:hypothetical protein